FSDAASMSEEEVRRKLNDVAAALKAAGLSRERTASGHGAAATTGYSTDPHDWRVEVDRSVAGEVISPILYDRPETWAVLEKVLRIIRAAGGTTGTGDVRAGLHVNIGIGDYSTDDPRGHLSPFRTAKRRAAHYRAALLSLVKAHEDALIRTAT